jgi:protein tyrosine/serine phosphatase
MRLILLFLALPLALQILPFTPSPASAQTTGLDNFYQVSPGIYRGGRPPFAALPALLDQNIKTIIDLQGGDAEIPFFGWLMKDFEPGEKPSMIARERILSTQLGFQFVNYPLSSIKNVNATEAGWIKDILAIMADPANQPVFVHCEHGIDRTGLIIALYRVFDEGWTPQAAHDEMMAMGHGNLGNQILTGAMDRYFRKVTRNLGRIASDGDGQ